jgi:predicted pyridoxine 5'-phosphate oxidase superfamily flavin-nucleotide-binding protein
VSGTRLSDENTLAVPDRRGNNRIDSLRNLIIDPRVALLFLIPGVGRKDAGRDQRRQGRRGPARSHGTRENEGNDLLNVGQTRE